MEYCDTCGGLIVAERKDGETTFKCRKCDETYEDTGDGLRITEKNEEERKRIDVEEPDEDNLPTTEWECEECGNDTAYWWMLQTRAADEPETRFFKCTECSHTIREYD